MSGRSPGAILRDLEHAQAALRKARGVVNESRTGGMEPAAAARIAWDSLAHAARLIAEIPLDAADDQVMTRQIALQRYATSLLVRLRRLLRGSAAPADDELAEEDEV